jgi:HAD superfamily hydrolase (TIGR01549 family)
MLKNLFLDAGGVILNEDTHEKIRSEIISGLLNNYQPYPTDDYWKDAEDAVYRFVPHVYNYIIYKNTHNIEEFNNTVSEYRTKWKTLNPELTLMNGINKILPVLSGCFRIGILGQYEMELKYLLEKNDLLKYFSFKNTQDEFSITKPDPRYFKQVLKKAGVMPEESIMVGDRIDKDIIPAKQIGMTTVRIRTGLHWNQEPRTPDEIPDYEYDSVYGLTELCK